jgi:hypothetical protein
MCTSKFDVEEEQFTFMKEYLSHNYSGSIHFINLIIFLVVTDWVEIIRSMRISLLEVDRPGVVVYEHPPTQPPLPLTQGRRPRASLVGIKS